MTIRTAMRAIETEYNGYLFRSRLEARWAVFFDAASIPYRYEPEGFELSDGSRYLPDFYLTEHDVFVEVKGAEHVPDDDWSRMVRFVADRGERIGGTRVHLVAVGDIPDVGDDWVPTHLALAYRRFDDNVAFTARVEMRDPTRDLERLECRHDVWWMHCWDEQCHCELTRHGEPTSKLFNPTATRVDGRREATWGTREPQVLRRAYVAARRARFEFGDVPQVTR